MELDPGISALVSSNSLTTCLKEEKEECDGLPSRSSKSLPAEEGHSSVIVSGQRSDDQTIPTPTTGLQAVTNVTSVTSSNQAQPWSPKNKLFAQISDDIVKLPSHSPPIVRAENEAVNGEKATGIKTQNFSNNPNDAPDEVTEELSEKIYDIKLYRPPHVRDTTSVSRSSPAVQQTQPSEETAGGTKGRDEKPNPPNSTTHLHTTATTSSSPIHFDATLPASSANIGAASNHAPSDHETCVVLPTSESMVASEKAGSKGGFNFAEEGSMVPTPSGEKTPISFGGPQTPSKPSTTPHAYHSQQQSLVGQSPKKIQKRKKSKQASLVPSLVSQTSSGVPLVSNEHMEDGTAGPSFRSEPSVLINGTGGNSSSGRQKGVNQQNTVSNTSNNNTKPGENSRKGRKSPRNSIPPHHHYQHSPPAVLSPSNHVRRNSSSNGGNPSGGHHHHHLHSTANRNRTNAWIQTDSPNVIIESMMRTGSPVVGTASSGVTTNTNGFVNNYPLRYDNQWTRPSVDQLAVQIGVSSFFDMLPHYIDCCIGTKDTEKEVRQHVYHDVQAVVKGQFGLKADAHVYGSVVTDLALPFSDIDILVTGFHPMSPLDAIQKLSTALLEIDEGRLAELKHTLRQEVEQQKAENGDAASGHSRLGVEAGGQGCDGSQEDTAGNTLRETKDVSPFTTSPFVSPALMTSTLTPEEEAFSLPNSMEEKEHYRCREELESAEEEFRSQIVKDYTFSKKSAETLWAPISRTGSISEPTELSKGTNTEVTSTPVVPIITKMASVDSFREDSKLMERKCIRAEGEKSSAILEGMKTEGVDRAHINDAEDGDEESSSEGTRLDSSSTALALSQTSSTGTPTQRHPKKNAVRGASNEKCLSVNCSSPGSSHNDSNSVLPVTEMSTVGRATPAAAQGLPTYYTFVPTLEGPLYFVQTITSARVPVIKITEKSTKQRADITFGGGEHFRSLQMTQTLLETFPHSRPLIRFLKQCVARSGIGDSAPGGITSFAIYLMVRHVYNIVFNRLVHRSKMYAAQSNFAQGNNSGPTTCASPQVSSFLPSYDSKSCNADGVDVFLKICHEQMEHLTGKTLPCEGGKEDEALLKIEKSIRSFLGTSKDLSKEAKVLSNAIMESTQFSRTQHSTTETENQNGGLMGSTGSGAHGVDNFVSSTHHTANLPQREAEEKTAVVDDKISCTQSGNGTGLKSTANDITPTAGFYGKEESPENFVHFRSATAYLQDHMKVTHMFKEFCYYYGCQFNYESEGIRFTLEGMSEVVPKPFQCARRGQLFHLTSPFDPDYDVTARMTCMRDFQFLCEYFSRVAIPTFSFYTFLQWFSPHAYNTELLAVRDYMTRANVGASSAGMESEIASVMPATDSTVAAPGPAALPSNGAISNLAVSGGTGTSGMSGGEGGVSGEEEELTSAVVVDSVSAVASTGGDGLMQSSPLHIDVCGTTAATDSSETAVADSRFLDGSNTSTGSPQGRAFIKYPRNSGDSRRSGITTTSSKTPSPSSIVGGPELPHHHHHHHHHHLHHHQHHHHHHHHQHANSSVTGAGSIGFPSSPNGANGGKWDHYYRGYSQYVGACSPVTAGGTFIPQMYATPRGGAALSRGGPGMISPSYGNFYDANLFGYATMMSQQQHQIHQHQHQSGAPVNDFQHAQGSYMGSPSASPAPLSSVSTPGNVGTYTNGNRSGTTYPVTAAHMKATVQAANGIGEENVSKAGASTSVRSKSSSLSRPSNRSKITTKDNEPMDIAYGARSLPSPLPSPPPPPTSRITPLLDPRRQQCEALTSDRGSECAPLIERSVTAVPSNIEHNQESIPLVQEADCNIAPEDKVNLEWRE